MKRYRASASEIVQAPPNCVYEILADYRNGHPLILPKKYFTAIEVEKGGVGDGTIIRFGMRVLGKTEQFRADVTEPEPGKVLVETYPDNGGAVTTFVVTPVEDGRSTRVTITTDAATRAGGLTGGLESFFTEILLQRIYRKELALLSEVARQRCPA